MRVLENFFSPSLLFSVKDVLDLHKIPGSLLHWNFTNSYLTPSSQVKAPMIFSNWYTLFDFYNETCGQMGSGFVLWRKIFEYYLAQIMKWKIIIHFCLHTVINHHQFHPFYQTRLNHTKIVAKSI